MSDVPQGAQPDPASARRYERLTEAEDTLAAISRGEVDAFVVWPENDPQVLVLAGVDRPYRLFVERMQQGAATVAPDGVIIYTNGRLPELLGLSVSSMRDRPFADLVEPGRLHELRDFLDLGRQEHAAGEFALRRADGSWLPAHLTVAALLDPADSLCIVVTDLTQQKREAEVRESLAREQAARTAAEHSAEQLREADRRKNEFLAMLAHELRNPLGPLQNGIELLRLAGGDPAVVERTRRLMGEQVRTLVRLVEDLLDVERITQGKVSLELADVDVCALARRALDTCQPRVEEQGLRAELELPDHAVTVRADTERLLQVLVNLLNNAAKFTPRGGSVRLAVSVAPAGDECVLRVCDTGVGIESSMLPRIFDLFVQSGARDERRGSGLGIGLSVAQRLTAMHGGRIEAHSEGPGRGSEFRIHLPLHPLTASGSAAPGC